MKKFNTGFIFCAILRYNLAVRNIVRENELLVSKVRLVMTLLKSLYAAAKLREYRTLKWL